MAGKKYPIILIMTITFLAVNYAEGLGGGTTLGGRKKVANVKTSKEIQELGKYSVKEYNKLQSHEVNAGGDLRFSKVIEAEKQVVSGIMYYLKVEAFEAASGVPKTFDAEVLVKPGSGSKKLLNFVRSHVTK